MKKRAMLLLILAVFIMSGCSKSRCPSEYPPIYDKDGYCTGEDEYGNEWEYNY